MGLILFPNVLVLHTKLPSLWRQSKGLMDRNCNKGNQESVMPYVF